MTLALVFRMTAAPAPADDDARLLRAFVASGDRGALDTLLQRHLDACWRLALHRCGNAADAEDVVQDAVLMAMRQAARWRGGNVRAWLLGIVANVRRDRSRSERRRERREAEAAPPSSVGSGNADGVDDVRQALTALPERYRLPVCLRYLDGLDFPAIAEALSLRERTARTRVSRGLERLRRALAPQRGTLAPESAAALLASLPALPPPAAPMAAEMSRLAAVGPVAAAPAPMLAMVAALVAVSAAVATLAAVVPWSAVPSPPPAAAVAAAGDPAQPTEIDRTLDLRIDVAVRHEHYPILAIAKGLPVGTVIPNAFPFSSGSLPSPGVTIVERGMRIRDYLDRASAQLGLTWEVADGYVLFFRPMRAEDREADAAVLRDRSAGDVQHRAAARRLARSGDKAALRSLLLAVGADDERVADASLAALIDFPGTPWPSRRYGTLYHAFRGDPEVTDAVARAMGRHPRSPALLYLGGVLRAPGAREHISRAAGEVFSDPAPGAQADLAMTRVALSIAAPEVGVAWDAAPTAERAIAAAKPEVRLACAHGWARRGDPRAVDALVSVWRTEHLDPSLEPLLAQTTVEAIEACPGAERLVPMASAVFLTTSTNQGPVTAAGTTLMAIRDPAGMAAIVPGMADGASVPWLVPGILAYGRRADLEPLLRPLAASGSDRERALALGSLLALGDATAVDELVRLASGPESQASKLAASMLAVPDQPTAIASLAALAATRSDARDALANAKVPESVAVHAAILRDRGLDVRSRTGATYSLWYTAGPPAVEAMADVARDPAERQELRDGILVRLSDMGLGRLALAIVLDELGAGPLPDVAAEFGARLTRAETVEAVARAARASDPRRSVAYYVVAGLHRDQSLPTDATVAALIAAATDDPHAPVRVTAVTSLHRLVPPDGRIIAAIGRVALKDADREVREAATTVLGWMRSGLTDNLRNALSHIGHRGGDPALVALIDQELAAASAPTPAGGDF